MRILFISVSLAALLFGGAGCVGSVTNPSSSGTSQTDVAFDVPVTFTVGQSIAFQDGIILKLTVINDSRCPKGVQCIWAGELAPVFMFSGAKQPSQEFTLGTIRAAQATVGNYVITLKDATKDQATVTVSKK